MTDDAAGSFSLFLQISHGKDLLLGKIIENLYPEGLTDFHPAVYLCTVINRQGSWLYSVHCTEPEFVNLLRSPGIDSQLGGPVRLPHLTLPARHAT
jgi:hypothetical protein